MAITELTCGCRLLNQACVISPNCRASPKHTTENPPGGGGRVGAVPPTPAAARKREAAKGGGPAMLNRAGKYRLNRETGVSEFVETEGDEDDGPTDLG
jgi:hypothetical protein